jgi:hypothetical protein
VVAGAVLLFVHGAVRDLVVWAAIWSSKKGRQKMALAVLRVLSK